MKKLILFLFVLLANNGYSQTYKCVNAQGKTTYTDAPCKNSSEANIVLSPVNTMPTHNQRNNLEKLASTIQPLSSNYALTAEEAYAAIPHKRTAFEPKQSLLAATQIAVLSQLLDIADRAIVLKVIAGKAMQAADTPRVKKTMSDYNTLISSLSALNVTSELKPFQSLLLTAIQKHQRHFLTKQSQFEMINHYDQNFTPDIHEASKHLQQAYGLLMEQFPQESSRNKTAFYDYLCALDFL